MRRSLLLASLTIAACNTEGDVFTAVHDAGTSMIEPDAMSPPADATTSMDATSPEADAGVPADSGTPPADNVWTQLPDFEGGVFRFLGNSGDDTFLLGRNLSDVEFSLYRYDAADVPHKLGLTVDSNNMSLELPIGSVAVLGGRILWATSEHGIVASDDGGLTFIQLSIPWEDGNVGNGNGHYSRIVEAWSLGDRFCVHREVTPWVNFRHLDDQRSNEVRCLDLFDQWTTVSSSIPEGVRFFTPFGEDLYGFTAPLYNLETNDPKLCHSSDLGMNWDCFSNTATESTLFELASGRVVWPRWVDVSTPTPGTHTELWYSDDFGEHWSFGVDVPLPLTNITVVGELIYAVEFALSETSPLYRIDLANVRYETFVRPTPAHVLWMDLFAHGGALHFADSRSVRRFDAVNNRFTQVPLEIMPAIDLHVDRRQTLWAVDGSRTLRRRFDGDTAFGELFFDDTGWASGPVIDHADIFDIAHIDDTVFFGARHRKLYSLDATTTATIAFEDARLTAVLHPDALLWHLATVGEELFAAPWGGEEQNHGNGNRVAWGGGLYQKNAIAGSWINKSAGLPQRAIDATRGDAIIGAIHATDGLLVVATQAGVYRSFDLGAHWAAASGAPIFDASTEAAHLAGSGTKVMLARARDSDLYFASDGESFAAVAAQDLPAGEVRDLAADGDTFYAMLDSSGVYRSTDQGATWTPVGTFSPDQSFPARTFSLYVDATRILAGTRDGVWQLIR